MAILARYGAAAVALLAAIAGHAAEIEPPPLGAGMRPGSVRLPEPRLAPETPPPAIETSPGLAPGSAGTPPAQPGPAAPARPDAPAGTPSKGSEKPR